MSFESAEKRLGADITNFAARGSSVSKGESLKDTAQTLKAISADAFVIRHSASGAPQRLAEAKKELPHTACYYLSGKKDAEDELLQTCKTLKLDGLNVNYSLLTPSLVKKAKEAGLDLWVWTVNNAEVAKEAARNFHVSGITTDRPDTIRELLEP